MKKLVVLSGAGISAESGIQTFRDSDGLWESFKIEDVATPEAWKKDPKLVQHFYNQRRKQVLEAQPNEAHLFLSELEGQFKVSIVTQNIDDLHERAGSKNVLHLHGKITLAKSSGPNQEKKYYPIDSWELKMSDVCDDGFPLRPHVVWFGEEVPLLEEAAKIVSDADILIVVGTSLQVYPAANLIHFSTLEAKKIIIDPKANLLTIPKDFHVIQSSAVNALEDLKKLLLT